MILLSSEGEVDSALLILNPFSPALQTEPPAPLITLNISLLGLGLLQAPITVDAVGNRDILLMLRLSPVCRSDGLGGLELEPGRWEYVDVNLKYPLIVIVRESGVQDSQEHRD